MGFNDTLTFETTLSTMTTMEPEFTTTSHRDAVFALGDEFEEVGYCDMWTFYPNGIKKISFVFLIDFEKYYFIVIFK